MSSTLQEKGVLFRSKCSFKGRQMVRHQKNLVLMGSIPIPDFCYSEKIKIRGCSVWGPCLRMREYPPKKIRRVFLMLKTRDLYEVPVLFELLLHPKVYPFVRDKADTIDEYYFLTKKTIEDEQSGEIISRTILVEYENMMCMINFFYIR